MTTYGFKPFCTWLVYFYEPTYIYYKARFANIFCDGFWNIFHRLTVNVGVPHQNLLLLLHFNH